MCYHRRTNKALVFNSGCALGEPQIFERNPDTQGPPLYILIQGVRNRIKADLILKLSSTGDYDIWPVKNRWH